MTQGAKQATDARTPPVFLYRHYDGDKTLLYVGMSLNALIRLASHRTKAQWYREIRNVTIETFSSATEAHAAEVKAIKAEKPKYNIRHAVVHPVDEQRCWSDSSYREHAAIIERVTFFKPLYTVSEAVEVLRLSENSVRKLAKSGGIPYVQRGRRLLFTGWAIAAFIDDEEAKSRSSGMSRHEEEP